MKKVNAEIEQIKQLLIGVPYRMGSRMVFPGHRDVEEDPEISSMDVTEYETTDHFTSGGDSSSESSFEQLGDDEDGNPLESVFYTQGETSTSKHIQKGLKRKLLHSTDEIAEAFGREGALLAQELSDSCIARGSASQELSDSGITRGSSKKHRAVLPLLKPIATSSVTQSTSSHWTRLKKPPRRPGPLRVLEIFTWTCMVSLVAADLGWHMLEPVTLPRWDMHCPKARAEAYDYIDRADPDLIVLAWPCTVWSSLQRINRRTDAQRKRLEVRREEQQDLLVFAGEVARRQRWKGRALVGEQPQGSGSWQRPPIQAAFEGMPEVVTDMCVWNKRRPDNGHLVKKPTLIKANQEICDEIRAHGLNGRCTKDHEHDPIIGSMKVDGRTRPVSDWAGGYTKPFAMALVRGAEKALTNQGFWPSETTEAFPAEDDDGEDAGGDEPDLIDEDELDEADDIGPEDYVSEDEAKPNAEEKLESIPQHVREAVKRAHRRLGHPSRATFLRMLKVSNATKAAMTFARIWKCPVCASKQAPSRVSPHAASTRPVGFNISVHLDLKFHKDINNKKFVSMSIVDHGTSFHIAHLVKTRAAAYIAKKFVKQWIRHYGTPLDSYP